MSCLLLHVAPGRSPFQLKQANVIASISSNYAQPALPSRKLICIIATCGAGCKIFAEYK
ncbi:MAG: hypothetical protein JWO04_1540 [Gammaproteobacteria bacterium]|jgi:hypothetical protein|nr:hypothetical protein [Gammaproteobacteria bacterium]